MTAYRAYKYLSIPAIFFFYSYGEELNLLGRLTFLYFFLLNLVFALIVFKKEYFRDKRYRIILLIYGFILSYSLLLNYLSTDLITDYFQILNIMLVFIIFSHEDWRSNFYDFIKFSVPIAIAAGVFSHYYFGMRLGMRFQPISNIVFSFLLYQLLFIDLSRWKKAITISLLLIIIINILGSGRKTNLLFLLVNIGFFLWVYKPKLVLFFSALVLAFLISVNFSMDFLFSGDSPTQKRLEYLVKNGIELGQRGDEVRSAFTTMKDNGDFYKYIVGNGSGTTYNYASYLEYDQRKHIHFTPMNLYFRYGIFGLSFFVLMIGSLIYTFRKIKFKKHFAILFMCLFITFIDSLLRSTMVDFYNIIFLGLILLYNKDLDIIFTYRENSGD